MVTGAARGIGRAIASAAATGGARVALTDLEDAALADTAEQLAATGAEVMAVTADVTDAHAMRAAAARVLDAWGPVSGLVNNAGRNAYGDAVTMEESEWDDVFAVDLKGAWLAARAVLPGMIQARRGSIVNIASLHAQLTCRGMFPYAAAKAGLVG
jgi:NAD(P)-dependent dehydrogenase (short-subunit alcohol dehydrogenase family)